MFVIFPFFYTSVFMHVLAPSHDHLPNLQSLILGCPAGLPLMKIIMVMAAIFQVLFTDFYIKSYRKKITQVREIWFP